MFTRLCLSLIITCMMQLSEAQVLNSTASRTLRLKDGIEVMIHSSADNHHWYYYLPRCLQLSTRQNKPEISFLLYRDEASSPIAGGILHMLLTWGLDHHQEKELEQILKTEVDSNAVLMGAPMIEPIDGSELSIVSSDPVAEIFKKSLTNRVFLPNAPEQKVALAFKFSGKDAQVVSDAFSNSHKLKNIKFEFNYQYPVAQFESGVRSIMKRELRIEGRLDSWVRFVSPRVQ